MNHQLTTAKNVDEAESADPSTPFQTQKVLTSKGSLDGVKEGDLAGLAARIAAIDSANGQHARPISFQGLPPENDAGNARLFLEGKYPQIFLSRLRKEILGENISFIHFVHWTVPTGLKLTFL